MSNIKRVVILGAGGVGFWLTVALRRDQPELDVTVYDDDNFMGGFGSRRLPQVADKKMSKVSFLNGFVQMAMRDPAIDVAGFKLTPELVADIPPGYWAEALVVDATDMALAPRQGLWDALQAAGAEMLRVSYDGNGIVVVSHGLPFSSNPQGNYAIVPTMAQSLWAGGVGAAAVEKLLKGQSFSDYQMELKEVKNVYQTNS